MEFDPYLQWLNIPPDRRPPSYFDLLGLSPGETDTDRIEAHATRRYEHVRKYTLLAPHAKDATRILNEISTALNCLLDPARRQEYLRQLGEASGSGSVAGEGGLTATGGASAPTVPPPPLPETSDPLEQALHTAEVLPPIAPWAIPEEPAEAPVSPYLVAGLIGGGVLLGVVVIVAVLLLTRRDVQIAADPAELQPSENAAGSSTDTGANAPGESPLDDSAAGGASGTAEPTEASPTGEAGDAASDAAVSTEPIDTAGIAVSPLEPDSMPPPGGAGQGSPPSPPGKEIVRFRRALGSYGYSYGYSLPMTAPPSDVTAVEMPEYEGYDEEEEFMEEDYDEADALPVAPPPGFPVPGSTVPQAVQTAAILAFSRDGRLAVEHAGTLQIWDARQGTVLTTNTLGSSGQMRCIAFSPDSTTLAWSAADNLVRLWDMPKGQLLQTLVGYQSDVTALAFSPDGSMLALGSAEGASTLETFDLQARRFYRTLEPETRQVSSLVFSPDGLIMASASENTGRLGTRRREGRSACWPGTSPKSSRWISARTGPCWPRPTRQESSRCGIWTGVNPAARLRATGVRSNA